METKPIIHRANKITITKKDNREFCIIAEYSDGYKQQTSYIGSNDSIGLYNSISTLFTGMSIIDYGESNKEELL